MRFSVVIRKIDDGSTHPCSSGGSPSLFARLPDAAARRLHSRALHDLRVEEDGQQVSKASVPEEGWWTVPGELGNTTESGVEFLPLQIDFPTPANGDGHAGTIGSTIYCSYNGGSAASSDRDDIIEIDSSLHPFLSNPSCAAVSIYPLHKVKDATTVQLQPLTASDWELFEVNASFLEDGGLLRQVSIVYPDQVLPIRLGMRDVAMAKVLPDAFVACEEEEEGGSSADDYEGRSTNSSEHLPIQPSPAHCLRLVADTEVVVVPVIRQSASATKPQFGYAPSRPLRVYPTKQDFTHEMKDFLSSGFPSNDGSRCVLLDCPPQFTMTALPSTLAQLVPGWEDVMCSQRRDGQALEASVLAIIRKSHVGPRFAHAVDESKSKNGDTGVAIARLFPSDHVPYGHVALHTNLRCQLNVVPLYNYISLQLIHDAQIEQSFETLKKRVRSGEILIDFEPVRFIPPAHYIPDKPWRYPCESSGTTLPTTKPVVLGPTRAYSGSMSVLSFLGENRLRKDDMLPLSSGSFITLPPDFTQDEDVNNFTYKLVFKGKDSTHLRGGSIDSSPEDEVSPFPLSAFFVKHISALFDISKSCMTSISQRGGEIIETNILNAQGSFSLPENETMLNILPSNASSINESVKKSAAVARIMQQNMAMPLRPRHCRNGRRRVTSNLLITGETGSGKTHFVLSVAAHLRMRGSCATIYLDCKKLQASQASSRDVLEQLADSFAEAIQCRPSVLLLDDLDMLVPNIESDTGDDDGSIHHQQMSPALVSQVKMICDHIKFLTEKLAMGWNQDGAVAIIGTCKDTTSIECNLRSASMFSKAVEVPTFDASQRVTLFDAILTQRCSDVFENKDLPMSVAKLMPTFGKKTEGFRPYDLHGLASRVAHTAHVDGLGRIEKDDVLGSETSTLLGLSTSDVRDALSSFNPISHQSLYVEKQLSHRSWSSIGGLFKAKGALTDVLLQPVRYSPIFCQTPISLPKGLLLYGPPGSGKTFMLPALAQECGLNLITCRGPELLDKYIGASEAKVRQLFARAYAASPAILFLDDFDALAPRRGTDHTGVTDRVVNQLLTFLDGVDSAANKGGTVYIIAATSRPDKIDPALLRPGRLEKHIYVGYPESEREWSDVFLKVSSTREILEDVKELIASGDLFQSFGNSLKHIKSFSAADMKAVFDTAHLASVHDLLETTGRQHNASQTEPAIYDALAAEDDGPSNQGEVRIARKHLIDALRATRPSLSAEDRRILARIYQPFYSIGGVQGTGPAGMPPLGDFNHADGDYASGPHVPAAFTLKTTLR